MRLTPRRQARSAPLRRNILEAALACYSEQGLTESTVQDIARRAGVSVGSLYHQFDGKEALAAEVYLEGLRRYQSDQVALIAPDTPAREGILRLVRGHLEWVLAHPDWARFLFQSRRAEFLRNREADLQESNRQFGGALGAWFRDQVRAGQIRRLHPALYIPLLLGPVQEYVRGYYEGRPMAPFPEAVAILAESVWLTLRPVGTVSEQ